MERSSSVPVLEGLAVEAVEWLPSGSDAGLVRVRGRWTDLGRREQDLPALGLRRGEELRRFDSLPDARFGRDPAVWRATYLVPAALMDPPPHELWLTWESGARSGLPAPASGFEPPATEPAPPAPAERGGEVIDRAVLAERRARRAEAAERAQAQRAADALKAVEVLELRSAELERRLEALQAATQESPSAPAIVEVPSAPAAEASTAEPASAPVVPADAAPTIGAPRDVPPGPDAAPQADALAAAIATVKRLRGELAEQRQRVRRSELLRAADAVALATLRAEQGRAEELERQLDDSERRLSDAVTAREQAAEQVALARQRAAADAEAVRAKLAAERERAGAAEAAAGEARAELQVASGELASARDRVAARERELAAIATELADMRAELDRVRADAAGRAAELERRLTDLGAALAAERQAHSGTSTELETARAQLAVAEAANRAETVARAALDEEIDRERLARATLVDALDAARSELQRAQTMQADLVLSREQARAEAVAAEQRAAAAEIAARSDLETAHEQELTLRGELVRARERHAAVEAALESALADRASAEAALRRDVETAQAERASLRSDLDLARSDRAAIEAALAQARTDAAARQAALRSELDAAGAGRAEIAAELTAAREQHAELERALRADLSAADRDRAALEAELTAAWGELAAAHERIAELERELESGRAALATTEAESGGLLARIAELERAADGDLERRAAQQAAAAAAAPSTPHEDHAAVAASFDAAAAALRARSPDSSSVHGFAPPSAQPPRAEPPTADPVETAASEPVATQPAALAHPPVDAPAQPAAEPSVAPPAVAAPPSRPRIVTESRHPPRADVVGSSKRDYPWLRGALVKLAHDDPRAATRLLLGLVPVQRALVTPPLDYDLTIRDDGTYAISITQQGATAKSLPGPRPRSQAAFHVSADIVTLAELLAGVDKRMGRWLGPVRVHGRRRGAEVLRDLLASAKLDLGAAARAGAELDPDLVFRAFAYAIHPSWTKGHAFTVAQEIEEPTPQRWNVIVRDGAPVAVERPGKTAPDATVTMSRAAFAHLLRGEPAPSGERPAVRGDRGAVALLRAWTERAQGRGD